MTEEAKKSDNQLRSYWCRVNGSLVKVNVSQNNGVSFQEFYGNSNNRVRIRWYFDANGITKHIGFDFVPEDQSTDLFHVENYGNQKLNYVLLRPYSSESKLASLLSCLNGNIGTYYDLPPEIGLASLRFEGFEPSKKYQHLLFMGNSLAREVCGLLQQVGAPTTYLLQGQNPISEIDDSGRETIQKIGDSFNSIVASTEIPGWFELSHQKYDSQRKIVQKIK